MSQFQQEVEDDDMLDESFLLHQAVAITDMIQTCRLAEIPLPASCPGHLLVFKRSIELNNQEKKQITDIFVQNMEQLYQESDWGWDLNQKQRELFHITSRFLVLIDPSKPDKESIMGYVMFRFEWDDEEEPEHPVVFVYELQVSSTSQRSGIGHYLMHLMGKVASECKMWKVMLTCFKQNLKGMQFYLQKLGYGIDVNSPSRCGYEEESYEILSNRPNLK